MEKLRSNKERAKYAILLIWIVLAVEVIALISGYFQYDLLKESADGALISMERANANDIREYIITLVNFLVYIISCVTFIRWFRRAYYNLHTKLDYLSYSEGWAAGAWFVPILNLFRPYQIMKELCVETQGLLMKRGFSIELKSISVVGWWWTFWIIKGIVTQIASRSSLRAVSVEDLILSTILEMIAHVITIVAALFAVKVIKDYSLLEEELLFTDKEAVR